MASGLQLHAVLALARKDLRLTLRNRGALFFAFAWPVLMALFFGLIFGGGGGEKGRIPIAAVDEDGTPQSAELLDRLRQTDGLQVDLQPREEAERLVRAGKRTAAVIVPRGYGEAEGRLFHGAPRRLEIAADPSRTAESAMLEGILTGAAMQSLQAMFTDRDASRRMADRALADVRALPPGAERDRTERFLGDLKAFVAGAPEPAAAPAGTAPGTTAGAATGAGTAAGAAGGTGVGWKPLAVERRALRAERRGPANAFEVTFPQGILWGVIGSALGFALSLVTERTRGTLARLLAAPLSRAHVLAGKALACFTTILLVEGMLVGLGALFFGVRPGSWAMLAVACLAVAVCFVGIMMLVAVAGRTEQSAGGLGWAVMMPLTMFGGGMVPLFAMPAWMQSIGSVSPVKWGILSLEGAIWRGFGWAEMLPSLAVLVAVGVVGFTIGARLFGRQEA